MKHLTSAGGLVYRITDDYELEVVICGKSKKTWRIPKGKQDPGENMMTTAVREIKEETGLNSTIDFYMGAKEHTFKKSGKEYHKTTYYFLLEYVDGNIEDHDKEFKYVEWVSLDEAEKRVKFENEKEIIRSARTKLDIIARCKKTDSLFSQQGFFRVKTLDK